MRDGVGMPENKDEILQQILSRREENEKETNAC
jgi:hypothetical protein